jgi:glycosyltransferase involved in cell wall biosynthesis
VDGPDENTASALRNLNDPRVRVIVLPVNQGPGAAYNTGVREARGAWVSLLDDDDFWLPRKLEIQFQTAQRAAHVYPIIGCRVMVRSDLGDCIWPRRTPRPNEPISEYLFCQSGLFGGEGSLIPTAIFTRRELLEKVPFTVGLRRHTDADWILRAVALEGAGVEFAASPKPLAVWHAEENRRRISTRSKWRNSITWVQANRGLVTPRAYAGFLLTWVSSAAARERDWRGFGWLLKEAIRNGRPNGYEIAAHFVIWLVPRKLRQQLTQLLQNLRRSKAATI